MHACDGSLVLQDLYVDRPLPYLIGSKAFMEQDDVGLGDLSSDGETVVVFYPVPPLRLGNLYTTYM